MNMQYEYNVESKLINMSKMSFIYIYCIIYIWYIIEYELFEREPHIIYNETSPANIQKSICNNILQPILFKKYK